MTASRLTKVDDCFYLDGSGNVCFSVSAFLRANELPDEPRLKLVVIEELLNMFPNIRVLDE
jgi:hypothetical protein